ncbi:MAG: LytTR family transcriptional regulator DNA-binding domain-containing protein [Eubacterium sp.]|nr:LytTR family transcriptional regulator DNA-binding domain-containing protein [Eubacterium sp.]MBR1673718.1 LytTR family transcriptional regulator DNA-binding domain-containing protein [Eubacterium sp.]
MEEMIEIKVIIDENSVNPRVEIFTKNRTGQVDRIIDAIENMSRSSYPSVPVNIDGGIKYISQREIYRIRKEGRKVYLDTADSSYPVNGTITKFENELDSERFFRISQSEIINLYKVSFFDFNMIGNVSVELDNGEKSWVSRRCVKPLRDKLKKSFGESM